MRYQSITAKLIARTAIHIGSGQGDEVSDSLIRRSVSGDPLIPGTALAGALRSLITRLAPSLGCQPCAALTGSSEPCGCPVCQLFGEINLKDEEQPSQGSTGFTASRVVILNASLRAENRTTHIRDGVGIQRNIGAAARQGRVKFDLETLPMNSIFDFRIELRSEELLDAQLLAAGLSEWVAGRAWLGGRTARGLGAFDLVGLKFRQIDLNQVSGLMAYLKSDRPWEQAEPQKGQLKGLLAKISIVPKLTNIDERLCIRRWVVIEGTLKAEGALLTNDATFAGVTGFDHAPLLVSIDAQQMPVLSGASLRGVIRSHAERLARTNTTLLSQDRDEYLSSCPACDPNARRAGDFIPESESCDSLLLGEKILNPVDDLASDEHLCLACRLFGSTWRGSRLIIEDAPYSAARKPQWKMLDFLAIDRFTGGGADQFKFDALALWNPAFKFRIYLENPSDWELGWLALVLRDLQSGWLRAGMGASKGFGQVYLTDLHMAIGYLDPLDLRELALNPQEHCYKDGLFNKQSFSLSDVAPCRKKFIDTKVVRGEARLPALSDDSYFDVDNLLPKLYEKVVSYGK